MFISCDSDREPLVGQSMADASWVRLYPEAPFYLVQLRLLDEEVVNTRTVLFSYIEQVEQMLMEYKHGMAVRCVQVILPVGSKSSVEWGVHRLKEIWAMPTSDARRCVMADGTVVFTDIAGYCANPDAWTLLTEC